MMEGGEADGLDGPNAQPRTAEQGPQEAGDTDGVETFPRNASNCARGKPPPKATETRTSTGLDCLVPSQTEEPRGFGQYRVCVTTWSRTGYPVV